MTPCVGTLRVPFGSPEAAEQARAALAPDDDDHVSTTVEIDPTGDPVLVVEATAATPGGLLAALDDVLANLSVMEGVAEVVDEG